MGDDALSQSQAAHEPSLEQQVRALQEQLSLLQQRVGGLSKGWQDIGDILDGIDLRIDENSRGILGWGRRSERLEAAVQDMLRIREIMQAASPDGPSMPHDGEAFRRAVASAKSLHKHRTAPEKRHLRAVQGSALAVLMLFKWPWPKKTAAGLLLAALGAGTAVMPGIGAQQVPAMTVPHARPFHVAAPGAQAEPLAPAGTIARHHRCRDHDGDRDAVLLAAGERRVCRDGVRDSDDVTRAAAAAPVSTPASPTPAPSVTPTPSPSITPTPSPSATCTPPPSSVPQVPPMQG